LTAATVAATSAISAASAAAAASLAASVSTSEDDPTAAAEEDDDDDDEEDDEATGDRVRRLRPLADTWDDTAVPAAGPPENDDPPDVNGMTGGNGSGAASNGIINTGSPSSSTYIGRERL
jgi:hypothetical protein